MKITRFLIAFILVVEINITVAQDYVICDGLYSGEQAELLFNKIVWKAKQPDSIIFILGADSLKIQEFYDWSKLDGYTPTLYFSEHKQLKSARIAKKIEVMNFDFFSQEMKKVAIKREEFEIEDCGAYLVK